MQHTHRLGMYWDTLGWIYFRMGTLDQVEKYLSAAWNLLQDPVIGDHLGQLYEKQRQFTCTARRWRQLRHGQVVMIWRKRGRGSRTLAEAPRVGLSICRLVARNSVACAP